MNEILDDISGELNSKVIERDELYKVASNHSSLAAYAIKLAESGQISAREWFALQVTE